MDSVYRNYNTASTVRRDWLHLASPPFSVGQPDSSFCKCYQHYHPQSGRLYHNH